MKQLLDQRVLVLGLGESGLAMARWAARCGAQSIVVADSREQPPKLAALRAELPQVEFVVGFDPALLGPEDSRTIDRVLKSPGLPPLDATLAPLLAAAEARVIPVYGELDLFAQALHQLQAERGYAPKLIAITGTNGKTTTTMLCGALVERGGARVAVAGNVGPTMLDTLGAALDKEPSSQRSPAVTGERVSPERTAPSPTQVGEGWGGGRTRGPGRGLAPAEEHRAMPRGVRTASEGVAEQPDPVEEAPTDDVTTDDAFATGGGPPPHLIPPPPPGPVFEHLPEVWVLELSSFQLDGVRLGAGGFAPSAATVLNVSQDHLDWHGSMVAYAAAKRRVFGADAAWASVMVVNRDEPVVEAMVPAPLLVKATQRGARNRTLARKVVRFGLDAPRHPGDFGLVVENGMSWLVRALETDETVKRGKRGGADEIEEVHLQRLMPADALRIRGRHNAANALAALALASAAGVPLAPMLHGLRDYRGEPHRVQVLGSVGAVEAVDDSKGTNVGATVAAIEGLGADKAPSKLVVILGGDGKGQDFAPLSAPVARHARAVALIGRDAGAIAAVLAATAVPQQRFDALDLATRWCFAQAEPGDAVLLSPACASLDMFRSYAHRAEVFADTVRELARERGEELAA